MSQNPQIITKPVVMQADSYAARGRGERVGFVPTMGSLHQGHMSLVDYARENSGRLVVSIFVNPLQFDQPEDLKNYPRTWDADLALCAERGVDVIYCPGPHVMYPQDYQTNVSVTQLSRVLEGDSRPGHFDGVSTVVLKLFNAVQPDLAVFGEKDFQQLKLIQRMVNDLDVPLEVEGRPTVREPDGLAMSSRNKHLSPQEREQALCLWRGLEKARALADEGEREAARLRAAAVAELEKIPSARLEYVEVVDADHLAILPKLDRPARMVMACWVGSTRLIDNAALNQGVSPQKR